MASHFVPRIDADSSEETIDVLGQRLSASIGWVADLEPSQWLVGPYIENHGGH